MDLSGRGWDDFTDNCKALVKCGSSWLQPGAGQFVQLCVLGGRAGPQLGQEVGKIPEVSSVYSVR